MITLNRGCAIFYIQKSIFGRFKFTLWIDVENDYHDGYTPLEFDSTDYYDYIGDINFAENYDIQNSIQTEVQAVNNIGIKATHKIADGGFIKKEWSIKTLDIPKYVTTVEVNSLWFQVIAVIDLNYTESSDTWEVK